MPLCKNCPSPPAKGYYYTGQENTPLGKGYSACFEPVGKKMRGRDGKMYVVKKYKNGKRWTKLMSKTKRNTSPRMDQTNSEQEIFNLLRNEGASIHYAQLGSRRLKPEQILTMVSLMRRGIRGDEAFMASKNFNKNQIQKMLYLHGNGVQSDYSYIGAENLDNVRVQMMLKLYKDKKDIHHAYLAAEKTQLEHKVPRLRGG